MEHGGEGEGGGGCGAAAAGCQCPPERPICAYAPLIDGPSVRPSVACVCLPAMDRITIPRQAGYQMLHNQCGGRTATATTIRARRRRGSGTARRWWPSEHLSRPPAPLCSAPVSIEVPVRSSLSLVSFFVSALFKVEPIPVISERRPKREGGREGEGQQHRRRQERACGRSGRPLPLAPSPHAPPGGPRRRRRRVYRTAQVEPYGQAAAARRPRAHRGNGAVVADGGGGRPS